MPLPRLLPYALLASLAAASCSKRPAPAGGTTSGLDAGASVSGAGGGAQVGAGPAGSGGGASSACGKCTANEFCGYADGTCGKQLPKPVCLPVWNAASCVPAVQACGCDGKVYASRCAAALAGTDTNGQGGCTAPSGYFGCGASFCQIGKQYCRLTTGASQVAPYCAPAPFACSSKMGQGGTPASDPPALSCDCILAGDKDCPKCDGSAAKGFTASGCQGK